jgi:hypothetical protein
MPITSIIAKSALRGCVVLATLLTAGPQAVHRLPAADRPIDADFEDLFVAGKQTGLDHEMLFGLVDITFAPDGELYVLEERNHRVVVYGPDGAFRRAFGREGQGPGEFQLPMTLAVTAAGEVAVWDFQHAAYLLFTRDGRYLRNVDGGDWQTGPSRDALRAWPDGGVVYLRRVLHQEFDPPEDIDRGDIMHHALDAAGPPDSMLRVHHPRRRGKSVAGTRVLDNGPAFATEARWDVLSDGRLAVSDGVDYRVRLVRPATDVVDLIERPIAPRPTSEADRESMRERVRSAYENPAGAFVTGGGGGSGGVSRTELARRIADALEFADVIPVIRDLRVDFDDRLWIQRYGESYFDGGPIDVVGPDGEYIGTLPPMPMPDAFGPRGLVAWMENGRDVDVERVLVRRLPAALR